ncbi:hypothetical protein MKW94_000803 [Papaver nudicaule]|uniref:Cyclin-like domain-containing protein n=1 Tax=Papaver nudicaule TaxID=74823 RepID=A0AA41UZF3_PAPNU|nr:hypothetical protein [Papaver nudicaule]
MYVKHTEAMLDEIDQMVYIVEEVVMDIDSSDKKNPLAFVDYIEDIYAHHRNTENSSCVSPSYMTHQFDINEKMRGILIDWLIETLYLTVNLIDRFLECQTVLRKKLQLVGVTTMLLACKYEEVSVPVVEDLTLISDKAYTRKEVLDMQEKRRGRIPPFSLKIVPKYILLKIYPRKLEQLIAHITSIQNTAVCTQKYD